MENSVIITTPSELQTLITNAVNVAVRHITIPQKVDHLPEFLTIQEAAAFLNLAVPTLYSMVSRCDIPYIKKSKKLYFSRESLVEYLVSGKHSTKEEIICKTLNKKNHGE